MRVTIYGPNLPTHDAAFHAHRVGCADTQRGIYRRIRPGGDQGGWTVDATTVREVVEDIYADMIDESGDTWEDYAHDVRIFPCCDELI